MSAREVEEVATTVAGVAKVAVVGKAHDFLEPGRGGFVITTPDAPEDLVLTEQVIDACAGPVGQLQGAAGRLRRRRVPAGNFDKLSKNKLREMADADRR